MKNIIYLFTILLISVIVGVGCTEEGVTRLRERSTPPSDYLQSYNRAFMKMEQMEQAISLHKKISPISLPDKSSRGVEALTDGAFGSYESWRS